MVKAGIEILAEAAHVASLIEDTYFRDGAAVHVAQGYARRGEIKQAHAYAWRIKDEVFQVQACVGIVRDDGEALHLARASAQAIRDPIERTIELARIATATQDMVDVHCALTAVDQVSESDIHFRGHAEVALVAMLIAVGDMKSAKAVALSILNRYQKIRALAQIVHHTKDTFYLDEAVRAHREMFSVDKTQSVFYPSEAAGYIFEEYARLGDETKAFEYKSDVVWPFRRVRAHALMTYYSDLPLVRWLRGTMFMLTSQERDYAHVWRAGLYALKGDMAQSQFFAYLVEDPLDQCLALAIACHSSARTVLARLPEKNDRQKQEKVIRMCQIADLATAQRDILGVLNTL